MASSGAVQVQPLVFEEQREAEGAELHARLVAYTDAISEALSQDARSGVLGEHSYARARSGAPSASVRVLLAPRAAADDAGDAADAVDVVGLPRSPPPLPHDDDDDAPDPDEPDDDWEARVVAAAPSSAHARLALGALQALRDARLAVLARRGVGRAGWGVCGGRAARREEARAAARRLRTLLAPLWAWPGAAAQRPPAWLHARLHAHLPAAARALYEDVLAELRRAVPRLAERLCAAALPPPAIDPIGPDSAGAAREAWRPGPWLAWARCGCGRAERRWERRLAALVHLRVLPLAPGGQGGGGERGSPERWAAAALHAAKRALADVLDEAKGRAVFVGGAGAGGALAAALAAHSAALRGCVLLGVAPVTAEGARYLRDDTLQETGAAAPALVGGGRAGAALAGGGRRALVAAPADPALRLPLRARRRLRLPQHALDAALVDEVVRWMTSVAEAERDDGRDAAQGAGVGAEHCDEYAHLPALVSTTTAAGSGRTVEIVEGRVVSRVSGSTPLLLTPRRSAPPAPAPAPAPPAPLLHPAPAPPELDAADIMQLPIVFVDDAPDLACSGAEGGAADKPVTVTSGGARGSGPVRFTRVILAKRGMRGGPAGGAPPAPAPAATSAPRAGPHRVTLRRGRFARGP